MRSFTMSPLPHASPGRGSLNSRTLLTMTSSLPRRARIWPRMSPVGKCYWNARHSLLAMYNHHCENSMDEATLRFKGWSTLKQGMPSAYSSPQIVHVLYPGCSCYLGYVVLIAIPLPAVTIWQTWLVVKVWEAIKVLIDQARLTAAWKVDHTCY